MSRTVVVAVALAIIGGAGLGYRVPESGELGTQVGGPAAENPNTLELGGQTQGAADEPTATDSVRPRGHITIWFSDGDPLAKRFSALAAAPYVVTNAQGEQVERGSAGYYGFASTQFVGVFRIEVGTGDCPFYVEADTAKNQHVDATVDPNAACGTTVAATQRQTPVRTAG